MALSDVGSTILEVELPPAPGAHMVSTDYSQQINFPINNSQLKFILSRPTSPLSELEVDPSEICIEALYFEGMEQREQDVQEECEGTCEWLLTHSRYRAWKERHFPLLWIKGSPGTGKSTLMKYAVQKERCNPESKVLSFFFYGGGSNILQKSPLGLWRSLLHQVFRLIPELLGIFEQRFARRIRAHEQRGLPWVWREGELRDFFRVHVAERRALTIFVDALDECGQAVATEIVKDLRRLVDRSGSTISICFSCRFFPALGDGDVETTISVEEENEEDIMRYIKHDLQFTFRHQQDKLNRLKNEISSKASGSFQWANIALDRAAHNYTIGMGITRILDELRTLPTELSQLYSSVFDKIQPADRSRALRMMQWLHLAARPLSLTELRFAMISDSPGTHGLHSDLEKPPDDRDGDQDYIEDDDQMEILVRRLSAGLAKVKLQGKERVLQLIHESVNEFLAQGSLQTLPSWNVASISQGHHHLARICINYATLDDICERYRAGQIDKLPFLKYAVKYWGHHAEKAGYADAFQGDQPMRFSWPSDGTMQRWIEAYRLVNEDEQVTVLHYCSEHGLLNAIKLLPEHDIAVEPENKEGHTPLSIAAMHGHKEVVALLLGKGASADRKNKRGQTPLMYAAQNGHEETVRLLLSEGVDVDSQGWLGRTSLWHAARNGHAGVARLLIDRGAGADRKDKAGQTPLSCAAEKGHEAVVALLLSCRADPDSRNRDHRSPLWYAAGNGHAGVVALLLGAGADADARDNDEQTPLSWAASHGHARVVQQLLLLAGERGAVDVDSRDNYGRTPLWYAADNGHDEVAALLLEGGGGGGSKRAEPDLPDANGWTPLFWAAGNGYEGAVRRLLAAGACVDARDQQGRTPLSLAVRQGKEKVIPLLLEGGADVNARDCLGHSPLAYATGNTVIKLLLERQLGLGDGLAAAGGQAEPS